MNNFASIFEELSKLYEEGAQEVEQVEEKVEETRTEELTEAVEDEAAEDETPVEDATVEEPVAEESVAEEPVVEDEEPRRLICECDKCGALVIKDEADVTIDEETDLANVEDECQFCEEANGYKIVGVVAPYDVVEVVEDEPVVEEPETEEAVEAEDNEELEELLDLSVPVSITANGNDVAVGGLA